MNTIRSQAMELKDRLSRESGTPVRWVNSILAVPFAWIDVTGEPRNVAVLQQQELLAYIERQTKALDHTLVARYATALQKIEDTPPARGTHPRQAASVL
jgi:hypothetical protein